MCDLQAQGQGRGQQRNSASGLRSLSSFIGQDKALDFYTKEKQADLAGALVQSNGCNERW